MKDKVIIITGATRGIGRALAILLTQQGANVAAVGRSATDLATLQQQIEASGGSILTFAGDVADKYFAQQVTYTTVKKFGRLDALVNNAGFGTFESIQNTKIEDWDNVMATNAKGTFLFAQAAIEPMKIQGNGHIINVLSDVARRVFAGGAVYTASKYAQEAFTLTLRKEMRPLNIKVSGIYTGLVDTHFHAHPQGDAKASDWLRAEDVANAIVYVLSAPSYVVIDEMVLHPLSQEY